MADAYPVMDEGTKSLLRQIFDQYDTDGSGKLDVKEMAFMMETLGISASSKKILEMIQEVDQDGNDEIDFDELQEVVMKNSGSATKPGSISFAAVFERKKNGGPPMGWRSDKVGKGIAIDGTYVTSNAVTGEFGVVMSDFVQELPDGQDPGAWLSASSFSEATALLEFESLGGEAYVGILGKNFNAREHDKGEWDIPLCTSKERPGMAPWAAVRTSDGNVFVKGKATPLVLGSVKEGNRIAFEINMHSQSMVVKCLKMIVGKDGLPTEDPPQWDDSSKVDLANLPPEVGVAVSLGDSAEGKPTKVRFVGSWCAKTPKPTAGQLDGSDAAVSVDTKVDPMIAAAQSTAM